MQTEKWFEIAAKQGDEDSVKARDRLASHVASEIKHPGIGGRLDAVQGEA